MIFNCNFEWWPWYDPEALLGMIFIPAFHLIQAIVIIVLGINFFIKETRYNGLIVFFSIIMYGLFIFILDVAIPNKAIFYSILVVEIIMYILLIIRILTYSIRAFSKVKKEG